MPCSDDGGGGECMVLRLEAEEVTQYGDDLDAERKRELLSVLLASLDAVLAFLRKVRGAPLHHAADNCEGYFFQDGVLHPFVPSRGPVVVMSDTQQLRA